MSTHTPGPLFPIKGTPHFATPTKEQLRLLEAAPDLLAALRNMTECAEAGTDGANMDLWIEQARAAIAKAEGTQ